MHGRGWLGVRRAVDAVSRGCRRAAKLALLLLGFQFVRMARRVRAAGKAPVGLQSFLVAAFVCGVFGAFLRGTGYFAGPVMLAALSFFWMQALSRPMPLNAKKPSETVDGERS